MGGAFQADAGTIWGPFLASEGHWGSLHVLGTLGALRAIVSFFATQEFEIFGHIPKTQIKNMTFSITGNSYGFPNKTGHWNGLVRELADKVFRYLHVNVEDR